MMNKIFDQDISDMLKLYMDGIIIMYGEELIHKIHVTNVFNRVCQYNMRLNPKKFSFRVKADKFL